jgi:hypothetical protein
VVGVICFLGWFVFWFIWELVYFLMLCRVVGIFGGLFLGSFGPFCGCFVFCVFFRHPFSFLLFLFLIMLFSCGGVAKFLDDQLMNSAISPKGEIISGKDYGLFR